MARGGSEKATVRPNGPGTDGVPVKIEKHPSGGWSVVAGAGGRLAHLHIDHLKSPAEWKAHAKENAQKKREKSAAEQARVKEQAAKLGVKPEVVAQKREQASADIHTAERDRVMRVAKYMNWGEDALRLDPEVLQGMPPEQQAKALAVHHRQLVQKADAVLKQIRTGLVKSATARAEAGLEGATDEMRRSISLDDILPPHHPSGKGYAADVGGRLQAKSAVDNHVYRLDEDGVRKETTQLLEDFRKTQVLPGQSETAESRTRGDEAHAAFNKKVETKLKDQDLYGARKLLADATIELREVKPEVLRAQADAAKAGGEPDLAMASHEARAEMGAQRRRLSDRIREMSGIERLPTNPTSFAGAVELLGAEKQAKTSLDKAREVRKGPEQAAVEEKVGKNTYQIAKMEPAEARAGVEKDIENGIREKLAHSLLQAYDGSLEQDIHASPEEREHQLSQALVIGAHQALTNASFVFAGQRGLPREAVDVLGVAGAAQVLAAHLRASLDPREREKAVEAIGQFHADETKNDTAVALKDAETAYDSARAIEIPDKVSTGDEIAEATERIERKRELLEDARDSIGIMLGKFEATAALEFALGQPQNAPIEVTMPGVSRETLVRQMHALGLEEKTDYTWTHDGKNGYVELSKDAHAKLLRPDDPALRERQTAIRDIKSGLQDEKGYMPPGFAKRAKSSFEQHGQPLPDLATDFRLGASVKQSLLDYVGSRVANGEPIWKILPTLNDASSGPLQAALAAGKGDAYKAALDELAPVRTEGGKPAGPADWQGNFDAASEAFMKRAHPDADPIHMQRLKLDSPEEQKNGLEALHRTLAPNPALKAALKTPGEMTGAERKGLREWFMKEVVRKGSAGQSADIAKVRGHLEEIDKKKPEEFEESLFGTKERTPEFLDWQKKRTELATSLADLTKSGEDATWDDYASMVGSSDKALETAAEFARGTLAENFAHHYEAVTGQKIRTSQRKISNDDLHDIGVDPEARAEHKAWMQQQGGELRRGHLGRYQSSAVKERLARLQSAQERQELNQGVLLGGPAGPDVKHARVTLGDAMERQLAGLADAHFQTMTPRMGAIPVIPDANMDGKAIDQQRMVKANLAVKKIGNGAGVGKGKTRVSLATFAQGNANGQMRRGLFAVPSGVIGGFALDANTWLEPGKFKAFSGAGTTREERMAAYKDPGTHMMFVGHEQMRDDVADMVADTNGVDREKARAMIMSGTPQDVDKLVKTALEKHGADALLDYYSVDEGHQTFNRAGKKDSLLAKISDSLLRQSKYGNLMTGTFVKNDLSEVQDVLSKLDPTRNGDQKQFLRNYDVKTTASTEALRREIDSYIYSQQSDPGTAPVKAEVEVPLLEPQKQRLQDIDQAYETAAEAHRALRMGLGDQAKQTQRLTDAVKKLWPRSFAGAPPEKHPEIAGNLVQALGTLRETAEYDAIHGTAAAGNGKIQKAVELAKLYRENDPGKIFDMLVSMGKKDPADKAAWIEEQKKSPHAGKPAPGVMFVRSLEGGQQLAKALQSEGLKVFHFNGGVSSKAKAQAVADYKAGKFDVMVLSDAGSAGLNVQRGRYSIQLDTPQTFKTHEQREGRINRLGQQEHEPHQFDFIADTKYEKAARERMLRKKGLHEIVHAPHESLDDTGLALYYKKVRAAAADRGGMPEFPMPRRERPN